MKRGFNILTVALFLLMAVGCGKLNLYDISGRGAVVAVVNGKELYVTDLAHLYTPEMTAADSVARTEAFVDEWIRSQIKDDAASAALRDRQTDIEQMVAQYRKSLIRYRWENEYVNSRIDTTVTREQIQVYYDENKDNFRLAGPIVRARVARIPVDMRQSGKLEDMFRSMEADDKAAFQNICDKNGYRYDNFTAEWTDFSQVLTHIPFSYKNFDEFLKQKRFYDTKDDDFHYMMLVESYLPTGDYSPLSRESESIRKLLIYKRRAELLKRLDDSLYTRALEDRKVEFKKYK